MLTADSLVQSVNPLEDSGWDARLANLPGATFFHSSAWARVLHETYRFRPAYFILKHEDTVRALVPLMEVNSWLTGRRGVSLPFTDECTPLGEEPAAVRRLFREIAAYGALRGWKYWELRGGISAIGAQPSVSFHGHHLSLAAEPQALLARCDSAVRWAVRKAEQSPLAVSIGHDLGSVRAFHQLVCQTRRRHGLPPQPFKFFENIHRNVLERGHGCVVLARLGDTAAAGSMFFHFGKTVLLKFSASDAVFHHFCPNNLVMWRAIAHHARAGFELLDFGRTSLENKGLRHYKLGWGVTEHRVDYARYHCPTGQFVRSRDDSSGWQNSIFRCLPSFVSRPIGAAAYRHVA